MLALGAGVLAGCKKEKNGPLDPSAMLALNAPKEAQANEAATTKAADEQQQRLTPRQVVEKASVISYHNYEINPDGGVIERGFNSLQRDFANNRLMMLSIDVISQQGTLKTDFLNGCDFLLVIWRYPDGLLWGDTSSEYHGYGKDFIRYDTVGYIPTKKVHEAAVKIKSAYYQGNYATCYKLFNEAFTFYPITGKEWRELQAQGKE